VKARSVAAQVGISVGSIYNLFGDLEHLIRLTNARTYDSLYEIVSAALNSSRQAGKNLQGELMDLAIAYLGFVESHQRAWHAVLAFNRAQTDFELTRDEEFRHNTARALWASIHGIVTIAVADGFLMQPIEKVKQQIEVVVVSITNYLQPAN